MVKLVVLVVLLGVASWVWNDRYTLTPQKVDGFYSAQMRALLARDAGAMCGYLAHDFEGRSTVVSIQGRTAQSFDKRAACAAAEDMMASIKQIGSAMGGVAQIDYRSNVLSIDVAPDKFTARVVHHYQLDVAGRMMNISGESTDLVGVRLGRIVIVRSEANQRVQVIGQR